MKQVKLRAAPGVGNCLEAELVPSYPPVSGIGHKTPALLSTPQGYPTLVRLPDDMNFFLVAIDGQWHGGWFRIRNGNLDVYSRGQLRSAALEDLSVDTARELLREMLTEMIREPDPDPRP